MSPSRLAHSSHTQPFQTHPSALKSSSVTFSLRRRLMERGVKKRAFIQLVYLNVFSMVTLLSTTLRISFACDPHLVQTA
jgi:hypothetical protein